jgi:hypothetical protein
MAQWNMPVEPDELLYALKVGNAAALNQMPLKHTPGQGLEIVDEETGQHPDRAFCGQRRQPFRRGHRP